MSKATDSASKKRKGASEPTETKKRTKVTTAEPAKEKSASKSDKTTTITSISSRNSKDAKKTKTKKETKDAKPTKPAKTTADDFAGFSDSEDDAATADHTNALLAGFSSDSESETEEAAAITKIPTLPDSADLQTQLASAKVNPDSQPGTIYVGRIPHGFYEPQMRAYFSQFGEVSRLRLSRNKLTGKPKHYAYIEFESSGVADIVAKTMDKYLMFGHILQVRRLQPEEVHPELYKGANSRYKPIPRNRMERSQLGNPKGRDVWEKRVQKEEKRRKVKAEQLKKLGYEFEMPQVRQVETVAKKVEGTPMIEQDEPEVEEAAPEVVEEATPAAVEEAADTPEKRKKGRKEKKATKKARLST